MNRKRIFVTGASGCIGHYITETLIRETGHEIYLLVRDPDKLQFDYEERPGVTILQGDLLDIDRFGDILPSMNCAILAAASWGGQQETFDVNVVKLLRTLDLLDPQTCEQVIYFSTASLLDREENLLREPAHLGTDYIRSKYDGLMQVKRSQFRDRVTILFPTLVLGGDENKPYSHLSSGLPGVVKWIDLMRFLQAEGSFHFIHALDIARVVGYLVDHPPGEQREYVLGNAPLTVNRAIEEVCAYLGKRIYIRIPLFSWLTDLLISAFNIQMSPWDRFCLRYRHFTYKNAVNPETFGVPVYCPTFSDVLKVSGIRSGEGK